jgi:outer membrane protein OmpA-like peptidoglycan-associated protein
VTGLQSGVTYMFLVRALNSEGQSRAAEARDVVLTLPMVADNLGVAVASWTAPSWSGGGAARYRLVLAPGSSTCATLEVTRCTLFGVPTATHYRVTLALVSTAGRTLSIVTGVVREVALLQAYFDFDSYALSSVMRVKITNLAKEMVKNGVRALTIYGHADSSGALGDNLALSRERAQAVASCLYEQLRLLGDTSVRIHVVAGGVSTLSRVYALDRNAIVVTSSHQVFALVRSTP